MGSIAKICQALNLDLTEATTTTRLAHVKWPGTQYVVHQAESTRWYAVEDHRRKVPDDNLERIQDPQERRRLGRLGLVPMFVSTLSFTMPKGPGFTLFEVYGPIQDGIRSTLYREIVFYVVQGDVVFTIGNESIHIQEGGAIGCDNTSIVQIDLATPIHAGGRPAQVMYIAADRVGPFPSSER